MCVFFSLSVCLICLHVRDLLCFCYYLFIYFVVLARPLLTAVWKDRISRILSIENRHYTVFIQVDLLASFSFGPVPNQVVKTLIRANQRREYSSIFVLVFLYYDDCCLCICRSKYDEA